MNIQDDGGCFTMRHILEISHQRPAQAQLEPLIQLIGIINSAIGIVGNVVSVIDQILRVFFGINTQTK
jgi:hypothetical protein